MQHGLILDQFAKPTVSCTSEMRGTCSASSVSGGVRMAFGGGSGSMLVLNDPAAHLSGNKATPVASLSAFASTNDLVVKVCTFCLRNGTGDGRLNTSPYWPYQCIVQVFSPFTIVKMDTHSYRCPSFDGRKQWCRAVTPCSEILVFRSSVAPCEACVDWLGFNCIIATLYIMRYTGSSRKSGANRRQVETNVSNGPW